jgi:hypothetical protein
MKAFSRVYFNDATQPGRVRAAAEKGTAQNAKGSGAASTSIAAPEQSLTVRR